MTSRCPYGYRIVGSVANERRLITWAAAFSAYFSCDARAEVEQESYLSAFTFGDEFEEYLAYHRTTKGYAGPCWSPWLWFDIDREEDLEAARGDAVRLAHFLGERYQLPDDALLLFFSGAKGFHVGLPSDLWMPEPSPAFPKVCRGMAERLAELAQVRIDAGIYDAVRAFRAPNSKHPKTGLHKRRFTLEELTALSLERLLDMAQLPAASDLPDTVRPHPQAEADWRTALDNQVRKVVFKSVRKPTLQRETMEFLRGDVQQGDKRAVRLFRAAANLAEFGCPLPLAHALLEEPALDSGLPPAEVHRQTECGWHYASQGETMPPIASTAPQADLQAQLKALWQSAGAVPDDAEEAASERAAIQWEGNQRWTPDAPATPEAMYPVPPLDMPFPPH